MANTLSVRDMKNFVARFRMYWGKKVSSLETVGQLTGQYGDDVMRVQRVIKWCRVTKWPYWSASTAWPDVKAVWADELTSKPAECILSGRTRQYWRGRRRHKNEEVYTAVCEWLSMEEAGFYRHGNINLLKPTGHVMHKQFNIQQLYVLPALYLCVSYLSENKQRLVPLTA